VRLAEAEDTLRAIGAGEVDAFVVSDGAGGRRVFALDTADRPYRIFVENMREGAATISSGALILYANRRLAEMLCCPRERIVGARLASFVAGDVPEEALAEIQDPRGPGTTVELNMLTAEGVVLPVLIGSSPLEAGRDRLSCLTFTDLSAHREMNREIARLGETQARRVIELQDAQDALIQQATHDRLTGLPDRAILVDRIDQALFQAKRTGRCTAVIFVDLDLFKRINDTQGHAAGDDVLRGVATELQGALRRMDTVARIGGDEFVVLVPDVDTRLHAVHMSKRLVAALCEGRKRREGGEHITASVGISVSVAGSGTAETLIHEADTAMYKSKSLGGARAEIFDAALGRQVEQRAEAETALRSALNDRRVIACYQPVIDLASGRITGFEALARIAEPDGSVLSPGSFVPVAEDSGLIIPLGEQMLALACHEATGWQSAQADSPLTVAVNLSARQFEPGDLAGTIGDALLAADLAPSRLHLELTETSLIDLHPKILEQLGELMDLGVEIGLDDFGTGYASLTHLRRLPLTFVKIDQSFVQGLGTDREDERIVSSVVDLVSNLGLRSIAEGVETEDQLARLRVLGCDQAQGYLFARPLPPDAVPATIQHPAW
jgi:diguanylate cyclase (GGDEF)-like protein/PAS domain S-box-containing protein